MYQRVIMSVLFLIGLMLNQTVNADISGKVSDKAGGAITGATLTLASNGATATTGADGMYTLETTDVKTLPALQLQNTGISLQKGFLNFTLSEIARVKYEIFDIKGNLLKKEVLKNAGKGIYRFNIAENAYTTTLLIIRASIGSEEMTFNYFPLNGKNPMHPQNRFSTPVSGGLAKITAVADTINVAAEGYKEQMVAITSYDMEVNVTLEAAGEAPVISDLTVEPNPNSVISAYVKWTTDKPSDSRVQFGVDGVQWEIADEEVTTEHEVLVIGMRAETEYRIHAISGTAVAEETFTTGTLPDHIPVAEVDMNDPARVQPGWTLVHVQQGSGQPDARSTAPPTAVIYDSEGYPVWYFVHGNQNERGGAINADRTDKGVLIGPSITVPPIEVDWAGNKLWSCSSPTCGGEQATHHAGKLSNGDYIVQEDVGGMSDNCWRQFTPGSETPVHTICLSDALTGNGMDWAHGNSITIDLEQDIAYMSFRWLGVIKMKYSTKERIWHLPASYAITHNTKYTPTANMTFIPPESQFSDIHDPEIHDDGTILFFDNGGYTGVIEDGNPGNYHSRAVEYAIDEEALTATLVWEWPGDFDVDEFYRTDYYVPFWGDADRLENGNVLIAAGRSSSASQTPVSRVTEIAKDDGKVVWEMRMPREQGADYGIYRAERLYPLPLVRPIGD